VAAGLDAAPTTTHFDAPTVASPITDARLQGALDYWRRQSDGKAMARRADIDPTDIPKLLPHVMLVEVLPSGRYRYRLIGTENAEAWHERHRPVSRRGIARPGIQSARAGTLR